MQEPGQVECRLISDFGSVVSWCQLQLVIQDVAKYALDIGVKQSVYGKSVATMNARCRQSAEGSPTIPEL